MNAARIEAGQAAAGILDLLLGVLLVAAFAETSPANTPH
jgi:hypothetical protein